MLALTAVLFWLLTDPAFTINEADVTFEGLQNADETAVRSHLSGIDRGPNVFRVRADGIVGDMDSLPDVDAASARVTLPASISVQLDERQPLFVWSDGDVAWLVDDEGMLFGPTADRSPEPNASPGPDASPDSSTEPSLHDDATRAGLPTVIDARFPAVRPTIGVHLPAADLLVMRQLLALTPELLGSSSERLQLRVDENLGYVLHSDRPWVAIFGRYTPRVQPPEVIPQQVQCLQALLAREEKKLEQVRLSVSEDGCGTFTRRK